MNLAIFFIITIFIAGYLAIILEHTIKINKTASALLVAVACWAIYFLSGLGAPTEDLAAFSHHVSDISQIIFFLFGAMILVELIDSHRGFKIITDVIETTSKKKMLWVITFLTFFLSSVLDNLTTTILMISLLRKLIPHKEDRLLIGSIVVVAANAGGAWTPIGDVTTTMLWINGQLSTLSVMRALFIPSLVSVLVPLAYFSFKLKGTYPPIKHLKAEKSEPGSRLVFWVGLGGLVFVPIFKTWTGLPPFMGILISLGTLWLITDIIHRKHPGREGLRVPNILSKIDTSSVLFFLGILLAVTSLQTAGILQEIASWLSREVSSLPLIATLIGLLSALIDNVPLVAATMGMYPLSIFPMDDSFWHMIAYAAGTGGSILIIGSASGVALMGLEKIDFVSYMKKISLPALAGFLAGMGAYLMLN